MSLGEILELKNISYTLGSKISLEERSKFSLRISKWVLVT